MKKVASILAVVVLSIGLFSCEAETSLDETQALYDIQASDDEDIRTDTRGNN